MIAPQLLELLYAQFHHFGGFCGPQHFHRLIVQPAEPTNELAAAVALHGAPLVLRWQRHKAAHRAAANQPNGVGSVARAQKRFTWGKTAQFGLGWQ